MKKNEDKSPPRALVVLVGDIVKDPQTYIKYNTFIEALDQRFPVVGVYNAKLHGLQRFLNLAMVWHPNIQTWRRRASKNVQAFIARSKKAASWIRSMQDQADVIIQLGALFDAGWDDVQLPKIIYTDYTAQLSARRRDAGRSPLSGAASLRWFELEGQAMKRSAHVCVRSQLVHKSVLDDYKLPAGQVSIIGGGVNLEHLPKLTARPENENPTILFIGLDFYRKGGDLVLQAFSSALASVPNARLLFVTNDSIPDGMPLNGVKIIPPIWEREAFLKLYSQADIFVLPSRLETWGDVILEAMAHGLPCIGVTGQPMEEIIRHGETGFLVPPEDVHALAAAFVELLKGQSLRCRMGQAGYLLIANEFTWEHVVDRIAPMIENAIAPAHRATRKE